MPKKKERNLLDILENWSKKHPFLFWGLSILYIISPIDLWIGSPLDDIILMVILSIVGIRKIK